jgi:hypothetical protein
MTNSPLLNANFNTLINQDVRTTASPSFKTGMTLFDSHNNNIAFNIHDIGLFNQTFTLSCPQSAVTATFPIANGNVILDTASQILTNKTINSASNTVQVSGTAIDSLINQDVRTTASPSFRTGMTIFDSSNNDITFAIPNIGLFNQTFTIACPQSVNTATFPIATGNVVIDSASQTLTNKTMTSTTNNVIANGLNSATTQVSVSSATAPTSGQVLTATSGTAATWQSPPTISTGTITPTIVGVGNPTTVSLNYMQIGNYVHCTLFLTSPVITATQQTCTCTLPILPTVNFSGALSECQGVINLFTTNLNCYCFIASSSGAKTVTITINSGSNGGGQILSGSFIYRIA